jgi:hypothetical protein
MMTGLGVFDVCMFENVMKTVTTCHCYQGAFGVLEAWRDVQMKPAYIIPSCLPSLFFFITNILCSKPK